MSIVLQGSTSGSITLQEPAVAGSNTISLPAATGTAVLTGVSGNVDINAAGSNNVTLSTNSTERMRIDSSGRLLVNTTATDGQITVAADGVTRNVIRVINTNTGTTEQGIVGFIRNTTYTGGINNTGTTTTYNTSSDYRLKENIAPMTGALAKVALLKPCTYTWKSTGEDGQGFIAHELQEVVPDCVTGEKDEVNEDGSIKPQGVDTSFLVATLTAAIQEQQAQIEQLKAEVQALKGVA